MWLPMYPAPPVTRTRIYRFSLFRLRRRVLLHTGEAPFARGRDEPRALANVGGLDQAGVSDWAFACREPTSFEGPGWACAETPVWAALLASGVLA